MFGYSRLIAFTIVFFMGFGLAAGLFVGIPAAMIASYSLRDLENTNLIGIPDEGYIDPNAPVDILDLNGMELYNEFLELQTFGDDLNMYLIQERYGLIFDEKLKIMMTEEAMSMPLKQLFSMEGVLAVLDNVFIGNVEGFTCFFDFSEEEGGTREVHPSTEGSYWVNADGREISGIEQIIANFSLGDFLRGNINTDVILHGDITLGDIFGYEYDEERGCWIDIYTNEEIIGIMAIFADCNLHNIDDKINSVQIGELLSYKKIADGEGYYWASKGENDEWTPVHSFMNAVAGESVSTIGTLFERITVGQIIPAEQRETGLMSIIPPDTTIDNIGGAVNNSVSNTPLQFFLNQKLVDFNTPMSIPLGAGLTLECTVAQFLDLKSFSDPMNPINGGKNHMVTFKAVNEGEEGYDEFKKNESYYSGLADYEGSENYVWVMDENGNYQVPAWRTKLLSQSFAYIITLMAGTAAEDSTTPIASAD